LPLRTGNQSERKLEIENQDTRSVVRIPLQGAVKSIYVVHLDHKLEQTRLEQLELLFKWINELGESNDPHIIMGDFNALTKNDYTDSYLKENIILKREQANIESVHYEVTEKMVEKNYIDPFSGRSNEKAATCQHGTRVDYVWFSSQCESVVDFDKSTFEIDSDQLQLSDHSPLIVSLVFL